MEIRKSGKMAVGIIAAMGTIGALHWFIFKDQAARFDAARVNYEKVTNDYKSQGNPPGLREINVFQYESLKYKLQYWEMVQKMDVAVPPYHLPDAEGQFNYPLIRGRIWDGLAKLFEYETQGESDDNTTLSFLGEKGWGLTKELPEELTSNQLATEDLLQRIYNENKLLKMIDPDSDLYRTRDQEYQNSLYRIGLNLNQRNYVKDEFGEVAATLFTLNRIQNVLNDIPEDFWLSKQLDANEMMYELFRIEWPEAFMDAISMLITERQINGLLEMVEVSNEEGIKEISRVKFHDSMAIYWEEPVIVDDEEEEEEEGAGSGAGMGMMDPGMMMGMGGEPGMGGMPGGMGMGMGMGMGGMGMMMPTPTPEKPFDSVAAPIEIEFIGQNTPVMTSLYRLSHGIRPYELDRLRLQRQTETDGEIVASGFFNLVSFSGSLGITNFDEVDQNIVEVKRDLAKAALENGAREIAEKDGFVVKEGNNYKLTEPSPTPWGGQ